MHKGIIISALVATGSLIACSGSDPASNDSMAGPEIIAMQPASGASYIAADQVFSAEFSEAMDETTVEAAYRVASAGTGVQGQFSWNDAATIMSFSPTGPLVHGDQVEIQWRRGMRSRRGQALQTPDGQSQSNFTFTCQVYSAPVEYQSNGERIYHTGISASGDSITFTMGDGFSSHMPGYGAATGRWSNTMRFGGGMMGGGTMGGNRADNDVARVGYGMSCAACHGPDGSGGRALAMGTVVTPDIRYATLTESYEDDEHGHTPYTDEDILRAIAEGVEPDGELLNSFMPRWQMSTEDAQDLLEFLKSL